MPPFNKFMLPLLRAISNGQEHETASIIRAVSDEMGLSKKDQEEVYPNRKIRKTYVNVGWAKTNLKYAGLLEGTGGGRVKITQKGLSVLKENPDEINRKYLRRFPSYVEWKNKSRNKNADDNELDVGTESPYETIERSVEALQEELYSELLCEITQISPSGFELLVLDLLKQMEYGDTEHVGRSGDGGIDGIITEDKLGLSKIYIQCKRYSNPVQPKDVREFIGALDTKSTKKGIFVTTSKFTQQAEDYVKEVKNDKVVILVDGERLVKLMEKHGVGVSRDHITVNKIDRGFFERFY